MTDTIIVLIFVIIIIFALGGVKKKLKGSCCGGSKPKNTDTAQYIYKTTVYIDGMTCNHCKARVENAFNSLPDCYAKVNLKKKCARVWTNQKMSEEELANIIKENGYTFVRCSEE